MDELKQALEQQKINGLEADHLDVLSSVLGVPRAVVARFLYAFDRLQREATPNPLRPPNWEDELPSEELRQAISFAVFKGYWNTRIAEGIKNGGSMELPIGLLTKNVNDVCRGCPQSLECLAVTLSTPAKCYAGDKSRPRVFPLKVVGKSVVVETKQPAGTYTIPLANLYSRLWKGKGYDY